MNTEQDTERQKLEADVVRFTAQLHDLERERTDTLSALNTATARLRAIQTEQARTEREQREREQLGQMVTRLRSFIAGNLPGRARTHAETVLGNVTRGGVYPDTLSALHAVSAAISGFRQSRSGSDYQQRQSAVANDLALLPTKPR